MVDCNLISCNMRQQKGSSVQKDGKKGEEQRNHEYELQIGRNHDKKLSFWAGSSSQS